MFNMVIDGRQRKPQLSYLNSHGVGEYDNFLLPILFLRHAFIAASWNASVPSFLTPSNRGGKNN